MKRLDISNNVKLCMNINTCSYLFRNLESLEVLSLRSTGVSCIESM